MKKLLFKIKNNTLIVREKLKLSDNYKQMLNTNVISADELIFSDEYILTNVKIVSSFINELAKSYEIDTIIIEKLEFVPILLNIIKPSSCITSLIIKEDSQLTFKICEQLTKTSITNLSCFAMQPFMLEYLDKHKILVECRSETLFLSDFTIENNLNTFSSLFYKMNLYINFPLTPEDEEDFEAFAQINKYLKVINVSSVNKDNLEYIISILRKKNKKNIKIVIHDNIEDEDTINYLRNFNKKKSKRYKIYFRLEYSNEYLKDNLLKQTNNSILKTCGYIILFIITLIFAYIFYDNYKSMNNDKMLNNKIKDIIINKSDEIDIGLVNPPDNEQTDVKDPDGEETNDTVETPEITINKDVASVKQYINPQAVGWLSVPNTNINYPVVQGTDNKYYLNHNIFREDDKNGWVFMDFRNDINDLSDNIIIYAHNRYYNGIMFGNIQNMMRYSYYTNPDNQIITLKSMTNTYQYKIFSMYKVENTTDYLGVVFNTVEKKLAMFNLIKSRSIYNFNVELNENDKILTLSTCADENSKYVVHAVLI